MASMRRALGVILILAVLLFAPILAIWLINVLLGTNIAIDLLSYIVILAIFIIVMFFIGIGAWFVAKVSGR